jgi:hypothetical protein
MSVTVKENFRHFSFCGISVTALVLFDDGLGQVCACHMGMGMFG